MERNLWETLYKCNAQEWILRVVLKLKNCAGYKRGELKKVDIQKVLSRSFKLLTAEEWTFLSFTQAF